MKSGSDQDGKDKVIAAGGIEAASSLHIEMWRNMIRTLSIQKALSLTLRFLFMVFLIFLDVFASTAPDILMNFLQWTCLPFHWDPQFPQAEMLDGMNANRKSDEPGATEIACCMGITRHQGPQSQKDGVKRSKGWHRHARTEQRGTKTSMTRTQNGEVNRGLPTEAVQAWLFWPKEIKQLWPLGCHSLLQVNCCFYI